MKKNMTLSNARTNPLWKDALVRPLKTKSNQKIDPIALKVLHCTRREDEQI